MGTEVFSLVNGVKQDAIEHETMLSAAMADRICQQQSFNALIADGVPVEVAKGFYPAAEAPMPERFDR